MRTPTILGLSALALTAATAAHIGFRVSRATPSTTVDPTAAYVTQAGDLVPDAHLVDLQSGTEVPLRRVLGDATCRLLYFTDPNCPACEMGAAYWDTANTRELESRVAVAWIGLNATRDNTYVDEFMERHGISSPRFVVPRDEVRKLHLGATPQVWGLIGDSVAWSIMGAHQTSPDSLIDRLSWCAL